MRWLTSWDTAGGGTSVVDNQFLVYAFVIYLCLLLVIGWKIMGSFAIGSADSQRKSGTGRWQTVVAGFYLILMCTQYWPIEGGGTSMVKVSFMCLSPVVLFVAWRFGIHLKVIVCVAACLSWKFLVAYFQTTPLRPEALAYSVAFFMTYMMFYTLVYNGCFSRNQARTLLETLFWAYVAVLVIQQIYSFAGGREWPLMNLFSARAHVLKCQSLSLEPSHSGRILGAVFYALLKIWEYQKGTRLSIGDLWAEHRWLTVGFLYAMISMQSATAIFVLLLLLLYFFSWKYVLPLIMIFMLLPTIAEVTESYELKRVIAIMESVTTGNTEEAIAADESGSYRVAPMLNMLNADYGDVKLWTGHGIDTTRDIVLPNISQSRYDVLPGEILDIGIFGYLLSLILVFSCAVRPFFSLPTLMFFLIIGGGTNNVAYVWGILMIFTICGYFYEQMHRSTDRRPPFYSADS